MWKYFYLYSLCLLFSSQLIDHKCPRPAAVGGDDAVDFGHEADRFVEGHYDAVVMNEIAFR